MPNVPMHVISVLMSRRCFMGLSGTSLLAGEAAVRLPMPLTLRVLIQDSRSATP